MATETPLGEVIRKEVYLSFADIFKPGKPQKNDDGEMVPGKFKANLLIPKKGQEDYKPGVHDANLAKLKAASEQVKTDKWGKPEKWPKLKADRVFLRDGDQEDWDGYEGRYYVSANNQNQPVLVDRKKDAKGKWIELTATNGGPKKLYAGAVVNAIVRIWAQDNQHGKRLNASLESVQFVRDGEAFSGAKPVDPNEKFDDMEDEDEDNETYGGDDEDDSGLV